MSIIGEGTAGLVADLRARNDRCNLLFLGSHAEWSTHYFGFTFKPLCSERYILALGWFQRIDGGGVDLDPRLVGWLDG
jgi:hypothetical protein